jgi:hypothetical protein
MTDRDATSPRAEASPTDGEGGSTTGGPPDRTIARVSVAIAGFTVVFAATFAHLAGRRFALGVGIGGVIGLANFVVLSRFGRALSGSRKRAALWGFLYLLKIIALFGGVYLLLRSNWVPPLSLVVGLSALVPGIVVGGVLASPRDEAEPR